MTHKIYKLFGLKIWEVTTEKEINIFDGERKHFADEKKYVEFSKDSTSSSFAKGEVLFVDELSKKEQENLAPDNRL